MILISVSNLTNLYIACQTQPPFVNLHKRSYWFMIGLPHYSVNHSVNYLFDSYIIMLI